MIHDAVREIPCFFIDGFLVPYRSISAIDYVWRGRVFDDEDTELASTIHFRLLRLMPVSRNLDVLGVLRYHCEALMSWELVSGTGKPFHIWAEKDGEFGVEMRCLDDGDRFGIFMNIGFYRWVYCDGMFEDLAQRYIQLIACLAGGD
jgi:hypothetical protein